MASRKQVMVPDPTNSMELRVAAKQKGKPSPAPRKAPPPPLGLGELPTHGPISNKERAQLLRKYGGKRPGPGMR